MATANQDVVEEWAVSKLLQARWACDFAKTIVRNEIVQHGVPCKARKSGYKQKSCFGLLKIRVASRKRTIIQKQQEW